MYHLCISSTWCNVPVWYLELLLGATDSTCANSNENKQVQLDVWLLHVLLCVQAVEALGRQHLLDLEKGLRTALDSRHLSLTSAAAAANAAGGAGPGPGGARGLHLPTPDAAGGWQVSSGGRGTTKCS